LNSWLRATRQRGVCVIFLVDCLLTNKNASQAFNISYIFVFASLIEIVMIFARNKFVYMYEELFVWLISCYHKEFYIAAHAGRDEKI